MNEKKGYVYIAEDTPDICKVGISAFFPNKRIEHLSNKYHRDFVLKGYFISQNMLRDEETIHQKLKAYNIRGEWFRVSYSEIKKILENEFKFEDFFADSEFINYQIQMPIEFFQYLEELLETNKEEDKQNWIREKLIKYLLQMLKKKNETPQDKIIKKASVYSGVDLDEDWK